MGKTHRPNPRREAGKERRRKRRNRAHSHLRHPEDDSTVSLDWHVVDADREPDNDRE